MAKKTKLLNFRITEDMNHLLDQVSEIEEKPKSQIITDSLNLYFLRNGYKKLNLKQEVVVQRKGE